MNTQNVCTQKHKRSKKYRIQIILAKKESTLMFESAEKKTDNNAGEEKKRLW